MATNIINVEEGIEPGRGTADCDRFILEPKADDPELIYHVENFENGSDVVDLISLGITSFDQLSFRRAGLTGPVVLADATVNGQIINIVISGLDINQVSTDDFIFVPAPNPEDITVNANKFVGGTDLADVFVLAPDDPSLGNTSAGIVNFQDGVDKIDVSALGITSFAELSGFTAFESAGRTLSGGLTTEEGQTANAASLAQADGTSVALAVYFLGETGAQTLLDESDFIFAPAPNPEDITVNANKFVGGTDLADVFVLAPDDPSLGNTSAGIVNFQDGVDKIDVSALGITSFAELSGFTAFESAGRTLSGGLTTEEGQTANAASLAQADGTSVALAVYFLGETGAQTLLDESDFIFAPAPNPEDIAVNANEFVGGTDGADVFVLAPDDPSLGNTSAGIVNFQDGVDKIDVSALGITSFAELSGFTAFESAGRTLSGGLTTEEGQTANAASLAQADGTSVALAVYFLGETGAQTLLDESDFIFA